MPTYSARPEDARVSVLPSMALCISTNSPDTPAGLTVRDWFVCCAGTLRPAGNMPITTVRHMVNTKDIAFEFIAAPSYFFPSVAESAMVTTDIDVALDAQRSLFTALP